VQYDDEVVPWASHSLAFMTELVELQHWRCPWCRDYLPDSPRGTAIDHIIPRAYGGPHRRWNLQLLHQECNSAKGKKITAEALELADAHYLGELQTGSVGERGTVSHTVLAAASTWPPGPSSADPAVSLRPAPRLAPGTSPLARRPTTLPKENSSSCKSTWLTQPESNNNTGPTPAAE